MSIHAGYQHPTVDGRIFLFGVGEKPRTLCELAMMRLSAELRSKPEWWNLYKDQEVLQKWREAAVHKTWSVGPAANNIRVGLGKHQIKYVLDELQGYAELRDDKSGIQVSCFDRIWESDSLHSQVENTKLMSCIEQYRDEGHLIDSSVPIDPFLHPYDRRRTQLKPGRIDSKSHLPLGLLAAASAWKFTCLPTPIRILVGHARVEYLAYVNGLDEEFPLLCVALQSALGRSLALFERTLTSLHRSNPLPQRIRGTYRYKIWDEPDPPEDSDEEAWESHTRDHQHWSLYRPIEIPDIEDEGYQKGALSFNNNVRFKAGKEIQVIHRISYLTVDEAQPSILQKPWNIEGTENERIVACCMHFVAIDDIDEEAYIEFRMATTSPSDFMPHDVGATLRTWGLQSGDECNQHLGTVKLRSGLTIAFPNVYQHRLSPITLAQGCRSGRVVIVEFYLCDPDTPPILSTLDVAPQQWNGIRRALDRALDYHLPPEVLEKIMMYVDTVMTDEDARRDRDEMLQERQAFRQNNDRTYFCLPFSVDG